MSTLVDEYVASYDPEIQAWRKRADAENFAGFLAGELGINRKGVIVDKDGKTYRVHIPLLSAYWSPKDNHTETWIAALVAFKADLKHWAA